MKIKSKHFAVSALALSISTLAGVSTAQLTLDGKVFAKGQATSSTGPLQAGRSFNRLIIKFKDEAVTRAGVFDFTAARSQVSMLQNGAVFKSLNASAPSLSYLKSVSSKTHVAITGETMSRAELFAMAKQIEQDPRVAYAEIDERVKALATPNDPAYSSQQWHLQASTALLPGGANLPDAWDISTGSGVVVAVIDTGVRPHADLAANLLPGYDFISADRANVFTTANDGDGRDSDASDPGDWVAAGACATGSTAANSSWHGTHVSGTIAAVTNNGVGGAGVAFNAKILPVRALGVCGGFATDLAAGMRWAAGLEVPGVPANPNKAKVLNLSLGGSVACGPTLQDTVNAVRGVGSVIVAATGNDGSRILNTPANCAGVIAVTGHTKQGDNADYANIGAGTVISGPGGGFGSTIPGDGALVFSTMNAGTTVPGADSYKGYQGTSMATPHVAGVAALLAGLQPTITPDSLSSILISSARAHPAGTYCATRTDCGAGLLDAKAAIDRLNSTEPTVSTLANQPGVQPTGSTVSFTAAAFAKNGGDPVFTYKWTQISGPAVTLLNSSSATTSFVAPAVGSSYSFEVKATDGAAKTALNQVSVTTNTAPVLSPIAAQSVIQGSNLSFTVSATDAEKNPLVFSTSGLPAGASLNATTGVFTWNNASPAGNYAVTITPSDGTFSGLAQTVSIAVTGSAAGAQPAASGGGGGGAIGWFDVSALMSLAGFGLYFGRQQHLHRRKK